MKDNGQRRREANEERYTNTGTCGMSAAAREQIERASLARER